jgi:hypothetical protein
MTELTNNLHFKNFLQEWEDKDKDKIVSRQTFSLIKRDKWLLYSVLCDTAKNHKFIMMSDKLPPLLCEMTKPYLLAVVDPEIELT